MRRTRKPVGGVPLKKKKKKRERGRERERGRAGEGERGREVKHYRGKESRAGKTVFKNATNDKQQQQQQQRGRQHNTVTAHRNKPKAQHTGKRQRRRD